MGFHQGDVPGLVDSKTRSSFQMGSSDIKEDEA